MLTFNQLASFHHLSICDFPLSRKDPWYESEFMYRCTHSSIKFVCIVRLHPDHDTMICLSHSLPDRECNAVWSFPTKNRLKKKRFNGFYVVQVFQYEQMSLSKPPGNAHADRQCCQCFLWSQNKNLKKSIISLETIEGIFCCNFQCIHCNTSHSFGLCLLSVDLNEIGVMHGPW